MSELGVFAVDRGIWDHPALQEEGRPFSKREAWLWLISQAAWKPHRVSRSGKMIDLVRGQLCHSLRYMAAQWGWAEARVRRFLATLTEDLMLGTQSDAGTTVITISKYGDYQRVSMPAKAIPDAPSDAPPTHDRRKEEDTKSKEALKLPSSKTTNLRAVADATRPDAGKIFDQEFWPNYPKRDGANPKAPARKTFIAAVKSGHDPTAIVSGIVRYRAQLREKGQEATSYVAQALTWLRQARWEDYPATAPPSAAIPAHLVPPPGAPSIEEALATYRKPNENVGTVVRGDAGVGQERPDRAA